MAKLLKLRKGTTIQHEDTATNQNDFWPGHGEQGEITFDTTKNVVVGHDGSEIGGYPLLSEKPIVDTDIVGNPVSAGTVVNINYKDKTSLGAQRTVGDLDSFTYNSSSADLEIDLAEFNNQKIVLDANPAGGGSGVSIKNGTTGQSGTIFFVVNNYTGGIGAWDTTKFKFPGGTIPTTTSTTASHIDRLDYIVVDGSNLTSPVVHCVFTVVGI